MIELVPMTESDYKSYLDYIIPVYAADKVRAGNWTEAEALERSHQEFAGNLPQGIHTQGNFVCKLVNEAAKTVGFLWYACREQNPDVIFIYDFEIYASFRRRGYAVQALKALEQQVKALGMRRLELHVFGDNTAARELYKKCGFIETNVNMARDL